MAGVRSSGITIAVLLVLLSFAPLNSAHHLEGEDVLVIDQAQGSHYDEAMNLTGSLTVPPTSVTWALYNISSDSTDENLLLEGLYFTSVDPIADDLWNWTLDVNTSGLNCTCVLSFEISEDTDIGFENLIVYLGDQSHIPVILDDYEQYLMYRGTEVRADINVIFPIGDYIGSTMTAMICESPYGVCLEEMTPFLLGYEVLDDTIQIVLDENTPLEDGIWMVEITVVDATLRKSHSVNFGLVYDTTAPVISLDGLDGVVEGEDIILNYQADDGYDGAVFQYIWQIESPDGKVRAATNSELTVAANQLVLTPVQSGHWSVTLGVRDLAGQMSSQTVEFNVSNMIPTMVVDVDGYKISNSSEIDVRKDGDWIITVDADDTWNDLDSLEYIWYVNGQKLTVVGPTLISADLSISGDLDVKIVIQDDNGVRDDIRFELDVKGDEQRSDAPFILKLGAALLVLGALGFVVYKTKIAKETPSNSIPKWGEKKSSNKQEEDDVEQESSTSGGIWAEKKFSASKDEQSDD